MRNTRSTVCYLSKIGCVSPQQCAYGIEQTGRHGGATTCGQIQHDGLRTQAWYRRYGGKTGNERRTCGHCKGCEQNGAIAAICICGSTVGRHRVDSPCRTNATAASASAVVGCVSSSTATKTAATATAGIAATDNTGTADPCACARTARTIASTARTTISRAACTAVTAPCPSYTPCTPSAACTHASTTVAIATWATTTTATTTTTTTARNNLIGRASVNIGGATTATAFMTPNSLRTAGTYKQVQHLARGDSQRDRHDTAMTTCVQSIATTTATSRRNHVD